MENINSINYARVRVSGTPVSQDIADIIDRMQENKRHYCANVSAFTDERRDCCDRLSRLENQTEAKVLQLRYCMNHSWEYIKDTMGYSESRVMQLRKSGIVHAYDVMPTGWRDPIYSAI